MQLRVRRSSCLRLYPHHPLVFDLTLAPTRTVYNRVFFSGRSIPTTCRGFQTVHNFIYFHLLQFDKEQDLSFLPRSYVPPSAFNVGLDPMAIPVLVASELSVLTCYSTRSLCIKIPVTSNVASIVISTVSSRAYIRYVYNYRAPAMGSHHRSRLWVAYLRFDHWEMIDYSSCILLEAS